MYYMGDLVLVSKDYKEATMWNRVRIKKTEDERTFTRIDGTEYREDYLMRADDYMNEDIGVKLNVGDKVIITYDGPECQRTSYCVVSAYDSHLYELYALEERHVIFEDCNHNMEDYFCELCQYIRVIGDENL